MIFVYIFYILLPHGFAWNMKFSETILNSTNACLLSFKELLSKEDGIKTLAFMHQHSSIVNALLDAEFRTISQGNIQTHLGNPDACYELGNDYHHCILSGQTKDNPLAGIARSAICLPVTCKIQTIFGMLTHLPDLLLSLEEATAKTCNMTLLIDHLKDGKGPGVIDFYRECQRAERVADFLFSVVDAPIYDLDLVIQANKTGNPTLLQGATAMMCSNKETIKETRAIDTKSGLIMAMFFLLFAFVIIASIHQEWKQQFKGSNSVSYEFLQEGWTPQSAPSQNDPSTLDQILDAFAVQKNFQDVFYGPEKPVKFQSLDGIRAFSMLWVMFGHSIVWVGFYFGFSNYDLIYNPSGLFSQFGGQVFTTATLSVDSFFFLSGFLAMYICIKKLKPVDSNLVSGQSNLLSSISKVPVIWLGRLLRLAIPLFFIQCWNVGITPLLIEPVEMPQSPACKGQYFWWNLLFLGTDLSNQPGDKICIGMTWYLQIDMRVFLFIPVVAILYNHISKHVVLAMSFISWVVNIILRAMFIHQHHASPIMDDVGSDEYQNMYFAYEYRYGVMVVGAMLAMAWDMWFSKRDRFTKIEQVIFFTVACVCCGTAVYGEYSGFQHPSCKPDLLQDSCGSGWSDFEKTIYGATHRSVWAIGLAFMCLLCFKDQFPFVNWFLSHEFFKPLARLSFMMYLAQEDILNIYNFNTMQRVRYSWRWFIINFFGSVTVVFLISLVFYSAFEAPFAKMTKMILKSLSDCMKGSCKKGSIQTEGVI